MARLKHQFLINLGGNLQRRAHTYEQSMKRFADNSSARLERLRRATSNYAKQHARMAGAVVAVGGAATVAASKQVANLDERINRLGIDFNLNGQALQDFKRQATAGIQDMAVQYAIGADEITAGIEAIATKTGDLAFANQNIEVLARTLSATGARGGDLGGILSEISKMGIKNPRDVQEILDIMIVQGKQGAFTLKDLSAQGERVFAAYGPKNTQQVREMGAALQTIRMATGGSEQAVTAFEAFLRALRDGEKAKLLQANGIQVFDPKALKEGKEQLRPINEIMVELVRKANGKASILSKALGDSEAVKALMSLVNELNATGDVGVNMARILTVQANDQSAIDTRSAQNTFNAQMSKLRAIVERFANNQLGDLVGELTAFLEAMDSQQLIEFLQNVKKVSAASFGLAAALKLASVFVGKRAVAKAAGKALLEPGMTPARPMYVAIVDGFGGTDSAGGKKKNQKGKRKNSRRKGRSGRFGRFMRGAKGMAGRGSGWLMSGAGAIRAVGSSALALGGTSVGAAGLGTVTGAVGAAGAAGYGIGTLINKNFVEGTGTGDAIGEGIAQVLAFFGNDEAQAAVNRQARYEQLLLQTAQVQQRDVQRSGRDEPGAAQAKVGLDISVTDDRVDVRTASIEADGLGIDVGHTLGAL